MRVCRFYATFLHKNSMEKERRHRKITNLIRAKRIETQQELTDYLERAGFAVTQSSVSRDLEELGIVKVRGAYTLPQTQNGKGALDIGLLALDLAGDALIVAKCDAGMASAVAERIDRAHVAGVVGTLAGENTVFIATTDAKTRRTAMRRILELF
jgi:transcriptional regulator of arginine metabolism